MFKAVFIDLDNTIINSDECYDIALNEVYLKYFQSIVSKDFFMEEYGKIRNNYILLLNNYSSHKKYFYLKDLVKKYIGNLSLINEVYKYYWTIFNKNIKLETGIHSLLKFFNDNNIKVYIITNFCEDLQIEKLMSVDILSLISDIVSSEEVLFEKPHPYIFTYALNKFGLKAGEVLYIGDSYEQDIIGSINVGLYSCYYNKVINSCFKVNTTYIEYSDHNNLLGFFECCFNNIKQLCKLGQFIGCKENFVQAGGGNISIKFDYLDTKYIIIKSSGINLSEITINKGYCIFIHKNLLEESIKYMSSDDICDDIIINKWYSKSKIINNNQPSIETLFHVYLNMKYVIHIHETKISNSIEHFIKVPYIKPGYDLCKYLYTKNFLNEELIILLNHGVIFQYNESLQFWDHIKNFYTNEYVYRIESYLNTKYDTSNCFICYSHTDINPSSEEFGRFLISKTHWFPCTPDMVTYCGSMIPNIYALNDKYFSPVSLDLNTLSKIMRYDNYIIFMVKNINELNNIKSVLNNTSLKLNKLNNSEINELLDWSREKYRNSIVNL